MSFLKRFKLNFRFVVLDIPFTKFRIYLIPVFIATMMKIFMFSWIQWSINKRPDLFSINFWWETFTIWDGGWYNLIARYGYLGIPKEVISYEYGAFCFPPGFPILIRGLALLIRNVTTSQILVSSIFGILWIPLFQLVTEQYLDQDEALSVTIIASLFPMIFIFTSFGYSEGLFLTFLLSSWYFYLKNRYSLASILVAGASIVRFVGIILIIPMIIETFIKKKFYRLILFLFPFILDAIWLFFGYIKTDNFYISFTCEKMALNRLFVIQYVLPTFFQKNPEFPLHFTFTNCFIGLVIGFLVIFSLLVFQVYKYDWRLSLYSIITLIFIVNYGNTLSYPRYLSFIFPIWFLFRMKNDRWLIFMILILGFFNLISGYLFARWVFLG